MTSALPPLVQACSGALASASANAISYPLDLVATRVQTTRNPHLRGMSRQLSLIMSLHKCDTVDLKGALRILKHILRTEGLSGLYDGLSTDTASTVLSRWVAAAYICLLSWFLNICAVASCTSISTLFCTRLQRVDAPPATHPRLYHKH